ncbi:MAG: four helix bundle protein [Anaerolineae bacterium]|nr:four helix bundle protein [Anaerolineae bacterium]MCO5191544.1 four helix bundle protein [Anaerolineae bacterium]MCO5196129.1 four helix bundle protein [Anaerolineae bacterium]MCO5196639.1 four helix bundle protein [Anaerolineae bacterium]MCO5207369.1 four helix bundle protein [Anaerolineae bacterium]
MAKVQRFEDLIAWQKARELTKVIYCVSEQRRFAKDFGLKGQMQRAAVSIMSNIAEGQERGSSAEFHRFLLIAKGSCSELRSQLYIASDIGYISPDQLQQLMDLTQETGKILSGLIAAIAKRR